MNRVEKLFLVLYTLAILLCSSDAYAQRENVWAFGQNAGVNFNGATPVALATGISTEEGNATVCDNSGALLFYTDGNYIWDRNHQTMTNGLNITGLGPNATRSTTQGALIVPMPNDAKKYYIFSLTDVTVNSGSNAGRLYYSIVDMNLNGGIGNVVTGKRGILIDTVLSEQMTSVSGNQCNVWVLVCARSGTLKAYSVNDTGIVRQPVVSPIIPVTVTYNNLYQYLGSMTVSSDRSKLAMAMYNDLTLYDFDANTGTVGRHISLSPFGSGSFYGAAFSPDNSRLYSGAAISVGVYKLIQYNLSLVDTTLIKNSRTNINDSRSVDFFNLKLGPDGKIYIGERNTQKLHVIEQPNLLGNACNVTYNKVQLVTGLMQLGFPNVVSEVIKKPIINIYHPGVATTVPCFATSYTLKPAAIGENYKWDDQSTSYQRTVTASGKYWVTYEDGCFIYTDSFIVDMPPQIPLPKILNSCRQQATGSAWMSPSAIYQYKWTMQNGAVLSTSDTLKEVAAGTYYLQISTGTGCDTTLVIAIAANADRVSFISDTLVCEGDSVAFENTSSQYFNNFIWAMGNTDTLRSAQVNYIYPEPGVYEVVLIGRGERCSDTATKRIVVDSAPTLSFKTDREHLCVGERLFIEASFFDTLQMLTWDFGDTKRFQQKGTLLDYLYDVAGTYIITASAQYHACPVKHTDTVYVHPYPIVNIGDDTTLCPGTQSITLQNKYSATELVTYLWNTGDITDVLTVSQPGIYNLTMASEYGCSTTDEITILNGCYLAVPNVFSPNRDGINDYFFPREVLSRSVVSFTLKIFNRWGQTVFETNEVNGKGWDGTMNGAALTEDVYVYLIEAAFANGAQQQYKGNVTLMR